MRLTGGEMSGRLLKAPAAGMRPTQDKVRAAVFSSLAQHVPGARVLDLFAGSGAFGLEAWSRGAAWVEWVEQDRRTLRVLDANRRELGVPPEAGRTVGSDVFKLLERPAGGTPFDPVLDDPPYAEAERGEWLPRLADLLVRNGWIRPGGVFVYETGEKGAPPELSGWRLARDKRYGAARILIWVREDLASGGQGPDRPTA